jgi:hypothetical protein
MAPTYTQVPGELFDEVMPYLSGAERKVLLYIIRRTFGFKKGADAIGLDQLCHGITTRDGRILDRGTQFGRTTVGDALRSLRAKNLIVAHQTRKDDGGSGPTVYALHMAAEPESAQEDPRRQRTEGLTLVAGEGVSVERQGGVGRAVPSPIAPLVGGGTVRGEAAEATG